MRFYCDSIFSLKKQLFSRLGLYTYNLKSCCDIKLICFYINYWQRLSFVRNNNISTHITKKRVRDRVTTKLWYQPKTLCKVRGSRPVQLCAISERNSFSWMVLSKTLSVAAFEVACAEPLSNMAAVHKIWKHPGWKILSQFIR